jgi:hypothetical protein
MTADQRTLDRLAKVCGLLGSDQMGERAAAALRADTIRQQAGLSWAELFAGAGRPAPRQVPPPPPPPPPAPPRRPAPPPVFDPVDAEPTAIVAKCAPVLTQWEKDFLVSIATQQRYSPKQAARLKLIRDKCAAWWTAGGRA